MVSSISSGSSSAAVGSYALLAIENFAKSFSKANVSDDDATKKANEIISDVDTDDDGCLTKDELKNYDTSKCSAETANKIKDLANNFDSYDKNGDGKLSLDEIKDAIGDKQYSMQELRAMAADDNQENSLRENKNDMTFNASSDTFVQALINNYKDDDNLSETVSYNV